MQKLFYETSRREVKSKIVDADDEENNEHAMMTLTKVNG